MGELSSTVLRGAVIPWRFYVHVVYAGESDLRTAPYRSLSVLLERVREQGRTIGMLVFLHHYHLRLIAQLKTLSLVSSSIVRLSYARATSAYTKTPVAFSIHKAEATQSEVVRLTPCTSPKMYIPVYPQLASPGRLET